MEFINNFYGIFNVVDQRIIYYHAEIIITNIVFMDVLLVLNVSVSYQLLFTCYRILISYNCVDTTNCIHGDIKLYGGQAKNEGDLQICYNGVWVFLCDWWSLSPKVACRQLGYDATCR